MREEEKDATLNGAAATTLDAGVEPDRDDETRGDGRTRDAAGASDDRAPPLVSQQLLMAYVGGDREAFRVLFTVLRQQLLHVIRRYFYSPFDQEEALQEVWLQLYRMRARFDISRYASFPAWSRQVARNRCIDLVKARRRTYEVSIDAAAAISEPAQVQSAIDGRLRRTLAQLVAGLDQENRSFFELCFVRERAHEEIARVMGISVRRSKYLKKKLLAQMLDNRDLREFWRP